MKNRMNSLKIVCAILGLTVTFNVFSQNKDDVEINSEESPSYVSSSESSAKKEDANTKINEKEEIAKDNQPTKSKSSVEGIIKEVGDPSRDVYINTSPKNKIEKKSTLKSLLAIKVENVEKSCDVDLSYKILKLVYEYAMDFSGAEASLRKLATHFTMADEKYFSGVSKSCKASLQNFGHSMQKFYLVGGDTNKASESEEPVKKEKAAKEASAKKDILPDLSE